MCISLISVRPAESVYRPVRPAERMCTGRCDPLRKCVQAGAARRENVYRPVRPAERMCTGWCGPPNGPAVQDFSTDVAGKAEFYFYH